MSRDLALFAGIAERIRIENRTLVAKEMALAEERYKHRLVEAAEKGLRTSWSDEDGRHLSRHWFFVRELVLDNSGEGGARRIAAYEKFWPGEIVSVRATEHRPSQIGTFAECVRETCGTCKNSVPIVGSIVHGGEHPQEPTWRIDLYALCGTCVELTLILNDYKNDPRY